MDETSVLLHASKITIWRGDNLLVDELSVSVKPASILQIQGSNGSGKTTLLRAMIGLADYDEGEVFWCGKPLHQSRDSLYSQLLYIGHKAGVTAGLTPVENLLALCPELSSAQSSAADVHKNHAVQAVRHRIEAVLAELGIADRIDLPVAALSAGQQRRVALARLRLQGAILWVLDEPLTSLDVDGYEWVRQEIKTHVSRGGAVMFTTHQRLSFDALAVQTVQLDS